MLKTFKFQSLSLHINKFFIFKIRFLLSKHDSAGKRWAYNINQKKKKSYWNQSDPVCAAELNKWSVRENLFEFIWKKLSALNIRSDERFWKKKGKTQYLAKANLTKFFKQLNINLLSKT